ncbi:MAG TPA: hypothetical protein VNU26_02870 [Mycobacteriales bacterium]|nr:hypothetical protein [Mycobacteriales bacterium]
MDPLDDLPPESRSEVVAAVRAAWHVNARAAEEILRASEPLWTALEDAGGLDTWGGTEFCRIFPLALALIHDQANTGPSAAGHWRPPRSLLVSASAGERVPRNDGPALLAAVDLVERCIDEAGLLPSETTLAIEVTLRYGEKRRPAHARRDASATKHRLASFTVQEPIEEMLEEAVPALKARFVRALLDCLDVGARQGTLEPAKVEAIRRCAEGQLNGG